MPDDRKPAVFESVTDMPDLVVSVKSMLWNRTGSWRYLKPRYLNKIPPCNEGCPAGNDIEAFIKLAEEGRYREAWSLLMEENPLIAVTGRGGWPMRAVRVQT